MSKQPTAAAPSPVMELAKAVQRADDTLSEVLVMLYHVMRTHEGVVEALRAHQDLEGTRPAISPTLVTKLESASDPK